MARLVRARDAEATRRALLGAGTSLFARRGFSGATAERIARKAGCNKAMINYHFRGKRGLYTAIIRESVSELLARLQGLPESGRPAPELLREFVATFGAVVARSPELPAMLLREVLSGGEHLDREVFGLIKSVFSVVRDIVERGSREGSFRPVDPLLTHISILGSLVFFFATEEFRRRVLAEARIALSPPSGEQYVGHIQDLITRGLVAEPAGRAGER